MQPGQPAPYGPRPTPGQHGPPPGYPQQRPGPPPQYPPPGYPPQAYRPPPPAYQASPARSTSAAGKAAGCLVLILLIGGLSVLGVGFAAGWFSADDAAGKARVGDCLKATGPGPKTTEFALVDCAAPDAAYKVAERLGRNASCRSNTYGAHRERSARRSGFTLCLTLNAAEGDCFQQSVGFPTGQASKVPCGESATYKVTKVVPGVADKTACGNGAQSPAGNDYSKPLALVYPAPPLTICTEGA